LVGNTLKEDTTCKTCA